MSTKRGAHQNEAVIALTKPVKQAADQRAIRAVTPNDMIPSAPGATSYEDERRETIIACFKRAPNFEKWKITKRLEFAISVANELFPELGFGQKGGVGFSRTAFYDTLKYLKNSGLLPSENVQK